jgi:hypothetical protein
VLVVGAGSGGQMVARELQLNPNLGARRSASSTTTRASAACACTAQGPRHDRRDRAILDEPARRGDHRDPVAPGDAAREGRDRLPRARDPVRTLPTVFELLRGGVQLTASFARSRSRTCSVASRCAWSSIESAPTAGQGRDGHRRGGSIGSELVRQIARVGRNFW